MPDNVPKPISDPKVPGGKPTPENALGSVSHLTDTVSHNHAHGERHLMHALEALEKNDLAAVSWNIDHSQKHFEEAALHAAKTASHIVKHPELVDLSDQDILDEIKQHGLTANEHYVQAQKTILDATKAAKAGDNSTVEDRLKEAQSHCKEARDATINMVSLVYSGPGVNEEMDELQAAYPGRGMGLDPDSDEWEAYEAFGNGSPDQPGKITQPTGSAMGGGGNTSPMANSPMPGQGGKPAMGGGGAPGAGAGAGGNMRPPKPSPFASKQGIPEISLPEQKELQTHVSIEFCLEHMARVLEELAENQTEIEWLESHRTLAEQWMTAAQMLIQREVDQQKTVGDAELKQQQLFHQEAMHQQTMAQNDQFHSQKYQQNDAMHKQSLKQGDMTHSVGIKQGDEKHKFDMAAKTASFKDQQAAKQQARKQQGRR